MKATKILLLSVLVLTGLVGCSDDKEKKTAQPSEQVPASTTPAEPVKPAKQEPAKPQPPYLYNIAGMEIRDGNLNKAKSDLDAAIELNPGPLYAAHSHVLKSLILGAELHVNQLCIDAVQDKKKNPLPSMTPERRAELERDLKLDQESLAKYEPWLRRLETIGQKRSQDLTAMEQKQFEDYEWVLEEVEKAQSGIQYAKGQLDPSPENRKRLQDLLEQLDQKLQAERKALLEPFKKSVLALSSTTLPDEKQISFDLETRSLKNYDTYTNETEAFGIRKEIDSYLLFPTQENPLDMSKAVKHKFYEDYELVAESFTYGRFFGWASDRLGHEDEELKKTLSAKRSAR